MDVSTYASVHFQHALHDFRFDTFDMRPWYFFEDAVNFWSQVVSILIENLHLDFYSQAQMFRFRKFDHIKKAMLRGGLTLPKTANIKKKRLFMSSTPL